MLERQEEGKSEKQIDDNSFKFLCDLHARDSEEPIYRAILTILKLSASISKAKEGEDNHNRMDGET